MKMLAVKSVDVEWIDDVTGEVVKCKPELPATMEGATSLAFVETSHVQGRVYINAEGNEVCIGMTEQVRDAIGLPLEAWEAATARIDYLEEESALYQSKWAGASEYLAIVRRFTLWQRIKAVFTGIKP